MATSLDITKRALAQIGTRTTITSMTDTRPEAVYANLLYNSLRDFLLREGDYDFALRSDAAVGATGAVTPWVFAYTYPSGALRIRQMVPSVYVALDPRPVEWNIYNDGGGTRKLLTREAMSRVIYTAAPSTEDVWDAIFEQAFTRLLGSALAFALQNRIEASKQKLEEALSFAGIANLRDG